MEQATLAMPSSSGGAEDALRSTPGRANFQRISRLIIGGGTRLLRETFDSNCKPSDLPLKLKDPAVEKALKKARLTKPQRDCLYPSPGVYGKSTDFDITLLFKLFRNMGFLSPPSTGWDDPPNITDHSLTADLVRLKTKRNSVFGHVNENMEIANDDFPGLWKEIGEILPRIAGKISVAKKDEWQKAIQTFLSDPLTPEDERYVEELLIWYRNDMEVKKSLEELKAVAQEGVCSLGRVEEGVDQLERGIAGVNEVIVERSQVLQGQVQSMEEIVRSEAQDIKDQIVQINQAIGRLSLPPDGGGGGEEQRDLEREQENTPQMAQEQHFGNDVVQQTQNKKAIPLCLPNNLKWNPLTGEITKTSDERRTLYVVDAAVEQLRQIKGPVCVVSIAGPYRKGKSYILSEAFDQPDVFPLGHEMDPETMGIWIWTVPAVKDSNGQEVTVVLLDSEGIDAVTGEGLDDNQIFTLTVLLASVLIYNSSGVPMRRDLEGLDFIVKLSQRIQLRTYNGAATPIARQQEDESFHITFPHFIWLLRDVGQALPKYCKTIKDYFLKRVFKEEASSSSDKNQDVAERILRLFSGFDAFSLPSPTVDPTVLSSINESKDEINPRFLEGVDEFKSLMKKVLVPKQSFNKGEVVTGEGLAALVRLYVDAINSPGMMPNIQDAWTTFVSTKCTAAQSSALNAYGDSMKSQLSGRLPCSNAVIRDKHDAAFQDAMTRFEAETVGLSTITVEPYLTCLMDSMDTSLSSMFTENADRTRVLCKDLIEKLKRQHLEPVLAKLSGGNAAKMSFAEITDGYDKVEQDYNELATGAEDVRAAVVYEFHPEMKEEMDKRMDHLRQVKDYDENLTAERFAKAFQEQERKRLEAERYGLQQQNREQQEELKMLIAKSEVERKRLKKQIQRNMEAQLVQISNMEKAAMERAREQREAFAQESKILSDRLLEMQKEDTENKQEIKAMSDSIATLEEAQEKEREMAKLNMETQRAEISSMENAAMARAEEQSEAFAEEKQRLSDRLLEMQKEDTGNKQQIKAMSDSIATLEEAQEKEREMAKLNTEAQRAEISNMENATMARADEQSEAFAEEKQRLSDRLLKLQETDAEKEQQMGAMSDSIAKLEVALKEEKQSPKANQQPNPESEDLDGRQSKINHSYAGQRHRVLTRTEQLKTNIDTRRKVESPGFFGYLRNIFISGANFIWSGVKFVGSYFGV